MATTMLATISSHSHGLSSMVLSPSGSLTSNTAGSPLPRIPRRTSSTQRAYCSGITISPKAVSSPVKITMQQATPLDDNSASTSGINADSSSCLSSARAKGPRGSRQVPAEPASPKFGIAGSQKERTASLPRESEPPVLILKVLPSRTHSETQVAFPSVQPSSHKSAPLPPALVVRKKSGQLVKPSLKRSKSAFKGSLSVNPGGLSSKSEPATPTVPKAVKFDSRLEHVKLFLAEQRPRAVSRDGSPTDDTSGTESDFPSFIFGDTKSKSLKMMVTNMPPSLNLDTDIVMEEMKLSSDEISIVGRVRVRNISFQKWIATRFTFDDWQTTSEVTARYLESAGEGFDIFGFSIRLSDLMARIEEKTLIVALRYNVDGREIWDNNLGQNYVVKFAKEVPKSAGQPSVGALGSDRDISSGSDISDLHSRLEQVAQKRNETAAVPFSRPLTSSEPASALKAETSLSSRYDFGASFKSVSSPTFNTRQHTRMHSYPLVTSSSVGSVPRPEMSKRRPKEKPTLGSPRDLEEIFRPAPFIPSDTENGPEPIIKNHQRGSFDLSGMGSSIVDITPPGTPRSRSFNDATPIASPRHYSFPFIKAGSLYRAPGFGFGLAPKEVLSAETNDGLSSLISPPISESESSTPGASPPFALSPVPMESASPRTDYNQFLDRFCFFTGSGTSGSSSNDSASEPLSRSSSISSIDEFLSSSSPRLHDAGGFRLFSPQPVTRTRDDISIRISSAITSTATPQECLDGSDSRSVTPTAR